MWGGVCLFVSFCFILFALWLPYKLGFQRETNCAFVLVCIGLATGFFAVMFSVIKQKQINSNFFGGY